MGTEIDRLSIGEIVRKVEVIISLVKNGNFDSDEGIFQACYFDSFDIYVQSVSDVEVELLLYLYGEYDNDHDKCIKLTIPSFLFLTEIESDMAEYLKAIDKEYVKNEVESDLDLLAFSINSYKEFAEEVLNKFNSGESIINYSDRKDLIDKFIDEYTDIRIGLRED